MSLVRPADWKPQGVSDLEPRAWEAVRQAERSVLVTAGAGAGKTEFLAQKATYLLQTGLCPAPKRILAISFKRDAASNLGSRVDERCPPEQARRFNSYTFDAFAKSLVDRFRAAIPEPYRPPAGYSIMTPHSSDYDGFLNSHNLGEVGSKQFERAIAETKLPISNSASDLGRGLKKYWSEQYNNRKRVGLSFPMLNRLAEFLLRKNPLILKALRLTYPVVFLDEFQDTTLAQFQLLCTAFEGSKAIFTAVGDDKQRIMGWAGAMKDAFDEFEQKFGAQRISLVSNWRSHKDLVRIQHVIARRIDSKVEEPEARAERSVDGDVAAIWEFVNDDEEKKYLARWIAHEVQAAHVEPHEVAILAREKIDEVEARLSPAFGANSVRLRNLARKVGDIAIQDLLGEELTQILLPLLRLGMTKRCPEHWNAALRNQQFLEAVDPNDVIGLERVHHRLQNFVREIRRALHRLEPIPDSAMKAARMALDFVGERALRQAFPAYGRQQDFDRVWNGFVLLLKECLERAETWVNAFDEFEGVDQVALMTIHKSKGLEFHTMIFWGLDDQTWWRLKPENTEELNTFFVAFTRAKQRAFFTLCKARGRSVGWIESLLDPVGVRRIKLP